MTHKYNVHKDFRLLSLYTAPSGSIIYKLGNAVLDMLPKGMRSTPELEIRREGNKHIIIPKSTSGNSEGAPCCLLIHGGGFNFKAAPYHYRQAKEYATATGSVIVMVDYSLAYNSSYGTPLQDCIDAWEWMCAHDKELGIDIRKSTMIGDSAGGFLAVKTAICSKVKASRIMLVYPVIDCSMSSNSMRSLANTPIWNPELNRKMWNSYLQGNHEESLLELDGRRFESLSDCYVETAEFDCLRDEGEAFAHKLEAIGVRVSLHQTKGTTHGFDIMSKSNITQEQMHKRKEQLKYP